MASMITPVIIALLMLIALPEVCAQEFPPSELNPEKLADEIFPPQNLDLNYQALYENLLQLLSHPLELNHATEEELRSLFILREDQVQALLAWRKEMGLLLSVYELQAIPAFDLTTIYRLMPLVRVRDLSTIIDRTFAARVLSDNNNYLITRCERTLEKQKGYKSTTDAAGKYAGSPDQVYLRFRMSRPGDFSFGITTEKDAGEMILFNPSKHYYGMDFISVHAQLQAKGRIKNLVAGDFLAQFGQGLVLGGGFGMGKGAETITTLRRSNLGFTPYCSVGESNFFRGIASSLVLTKNLTLHTFASALRRDAVANIDSVEEDYAFISSFAVTGLHRTPGELASRKTVLETNLGSVLDFKSHALEAGVIIHQTQFSVPVTRRPTVYNQFAFNGDHTLNASGFLNYNLNNFTFFGEAAKTRGHGTAIVAGMLGSVTRQLDLALLYRNYQKDYYSFYSNAISENTLPRNETGFYWGWKYAWSKKYSVNGYADLFHFPWLRYRAYAPGEGSDWLLRFTYQPSKTTLLYAQVREESKIRNLAPDAALYRTGTGIKRSVWINCDYAASPWLNFKTRAQFSSFAIGGNTTHGVVLLQDVGTDAGRFSFSARYSLFHTDDYDNRLYVYEQDVWLAFSFPAYYGTGIHTYGLVQFRLSKTTDLWLRWSHTRYTDRSVIGSAGETITGNVRNDVKLQARFRFF